MAGADAGDAGSLRLGWIGLGQIGRGMALRLADWPGGLTVFDLDAEAVAVLTDAGAKAADSTAALAPTVDVVSIMVRTDDQVRVVVDELLAAGMATDSVILVHSTIGPHTAEELAARAHPLGVHLVDAPVSGGPIGAQDGTLAIMLGGTEAGIERARPALERLGNKLVHAGTAGQGTRLKLARNMITFASFAAAFEAARLAEAAGLDITALGDVVRHSDAVTGGTGSIMWRDTTAPMADDDPWFAIMDATWGLGDKDLSFALALADEVGVDAPIGAAARKQLRAYMGLPPVGDE